MSDTTVDSLVRTALTGIDRAARVAVLKELVAAAAGKRTAADVVTQLAAEGKKGRKLALEFLARLPGPIPMVVVIAAAPLLSNRKVSSYLRVAAAGRVLGSVPDTPAAVRPVAGWLTVGLSRPKALARLVALQSRVRKCDTLDRLVAAAEAKLAFRCPRCPARLPRTAFVRHLWNEHKLEFTGGKARDSQKVLDDAVTAGAKAGLDDTDPIDRAFATAAIHYPDAPPGQTLQALAVRAGGGVGVEALVGRAAGDHAGVCPACLAAVPDPVPPLPPPLALGGGRLAGDGWAVDIRDSTVGRTVGLETPAGPAPGGRPTKRVSPRLAATLAAAPVVIVAAVLVAVLPARVASPLLVGGWLAVIGWLVYFAVRFLRPPLPNADDVAVDRAWADVVPGIGRKPPAIRFLTRLCRTSLRAGTPTARTKAVWDTVEHAAVLAEKSPFHLQWLGAARVLQAWDGAKAGRERTSAVAGVFVPFLLGETSAGYADAAADALLGAGILGPGDAERLAILLVTVAFEAKLTGADLVLIARYAPAFRRLLPADDTIGLLYAVWRTRTRKPWADLGPATPVFELAEAAPAEAKRILAIAPDCLLRVELDDGLEPEIGPVMVTGRGLHIGGKLVADPAAPVAVSAAGAGWELAVGPHRFPLSRKTPAKFVADLRGWLRLPAATLVPVAKQVDRVNPEKIAGFLAPLAATCPLCAAAVVVRAGRFGLKWDDIAAGRV